MATAAPIERPVEQATLKSGAIGFLDALVIGLASTAPAYSLAAVIGTMAGPADGLRALSEEHDARMIVVGTQGESPLRSAILGSTPHKLLQLSARPVLVVPPDRGDLGR